MVAIVAALYIDEWLSKYNGMPMYVALLSNGNNITFETMLENR